MWRTDLPTYRPTDTARCRVACPRLKIWTTVRCSDKLTQQLTKQKVAASMWYSKVRLQQVGVLQCTYVNWIALTQKPWARKAMPWTTEYCQKGKKKRIVWTMGVLKWNVWNIPKCFYKCLCSHSGLSLAPKSISGELFLQIMYGKN